MAVKLIVNGYFRSGTSIIWKILKESNLDYTVYYEPCHESLFEKKIKKSGAKIVIVLLGEVDTGFVIWYRSEKYKTNVSDMYQKAIDNYKEFLEKVQHQFEKVICISTPLPTIKDNQDFGEVANLRKSIKASQQERTSLTLEFNKEIQKFCYEKGINYISLDNESVSKSGIIKKEFLNDDPRDHHYNSKAYAKLLMEKLKPIIREEYEH
jgi:hypothetical protein